MSACGTLSGMIDSGRIDISLHWDGTCMTRVHLASSRPQAARALIGRPVAQALDWVPLLFSLCGRAQALCARAAAAAAGAGPGVAPEDGRVALAAEMAFEHLWRLWVDWPALLGLPGRRAELVRLAPVLRACTGRARADAAADALTPVLAAMHAGEAESWFAALDRIERRASPDQGTSLLPELSLLALRAHLPPALDEAFARAPSYDGLPAENSVLQAHVSEANVAGFLAQGRPIAARLAARLAHLATCQAVLNGAAAPDWVAALQLGPGEALARVSTARGVLLHRIRVVDGKMADYMIAAPTEWNFQPAVLGALFEGRRYASEADLAVHAEAAVLALDPCVERRIAVVNS